MITQAEIDAAKEVFFKKNGDAKAALENLSVLMQQKWREERLTKQAERLVKAKCPACRAHFWCGMAVGTGFSLILVGAALFVYFSR